MNTVRLGDHQALVTVDREDERYVHLLEQLVVRDANGQDHCIKLFPGMGAEYLRAKVERCETTQFTPAWLHCDPDRRDDYRSLLKVISPEHKFEILPDLPAGSISVDGRIRFKVTGRYFQAIAKIGFHYYLAHTQRELKGDEPCFHDLRRFIMEGGERDPFFEETDASPLLHRLMKGIVGPDGWCHILTMDESSDLSSAVVLLFYGPGSKFPGYKISLGRCGTNVYAPSFRRGHVYIFDRVQAGIGPAGEVRELPTLVIPMHS